ncbi:DUF29 domain-containing protein [Candidatus Methylobacter oryzae]|uniref:DUF29 domain-containing protein n=1 Tax=Candidatus Methylobacter oryzae TaxID=2497749 RepID=A0ABY3C5W6_9GAMM|nr:DUF29 domain-containing protein [Candidatus Methylobacter oryzae]TRW90039.1 DUF29 domain-containing protein [Candidatus Methylobacter oryzae]
MISYEKDFYGWTQEQAALLRAGRLTELDIENLIEEVETMGRSEKRELESRLTVLLLHLLKWKYQDVRRGRSWELSIIEQRLKFEETLGENPGLKPQLGAILLKAYKYAVIQASRETHLSRSVFPTECPWTFEQITDDNFFPD